MQDFAGWTRKEPARFYDLSSVVDYDALCAIYEGTRSALFRAVLAQAIRAGAQSVVVEHRYIDADYRSEHSRFYSTTFRRYPSITDRLHFFGSSLPEDAKELYAPSRFEDLEYLGYVIVRPVATSPVGRTMLKPSRVSEFVSCCAPDSVHLFGSELTVDAAPFMAQDEQLGVCVHVSVWICAYYHHLRFGAPRLLPAEIAGLTPMERGRLVPSSAITVTQLVQLLERASLPPIVYDLNHLPVGETPESVACRYLDSGMPLIVAGRGHAFVVVGYRWVIDEGRRRVQFIRQDDLESPYVIVEDHHHDRYATWEYFIMGLPTKVYMSGENAEGLGRNRLHEACRQSDDPAARALIDGGAFRPGLSLRTSVHRSTEFKTRVAERKNEAMTGAYQWMQMSRWVWVVELVDSARWLRNEKSVLAEVLIDATGHARDAQPLAWRVPGFLTWTIPDHIDLDGTEIDAPKYVSSVVRNNTQAIAI